MSNYFFTNSNGILEKKEYDKSICITPELALKEFISSFDYLTPRIEYEKINNLASCYKFKTSDKSYEEFYASIYQITPGGRAEISATIEAEKEFRIQLKAKEYNFIYENNLQGHKALQIGVYKFYDVLIFVAWKQKKSSAQPETPISTQVSIEDIAETVKYGFHQYKNKSGNYVCIFKKEMVPFYIKNSNWLHDECVTNLSKHIVCNSEPLSQIIYYGVPGSGKSHKIDEATKNVPEDQKMRVVFHPEYTNADFVGQILPVQTPDGIDYLFKAGPFSKILKRALKNLDKPYYLIIEEINRGNAAAIFGDLFQLLDRNSDGWSSYSIENMDINAFIRSSDDKYSDKNAPSSVQIGNITFTENTSIRLPPNLSLFATMNTSDQNVFTLDNAFQRRWDMKLVENTFEGDDADAQCNAKIGGTKVTWKIFQTFINKKIGESSSSEGMSSMEDKRLGCWFVKAEDNGEESIIPKEKFAEKVLKYLWDDAFKFNREEIFDLKDKTASLESIVKDFKGEENAPCDWSIFKDTSFIQSANE